MLRIKLLSTWNPMMLNYFSLFTLLLCLNSFVLTVTGDANKKPMQRIVEHPQNVSARVGETVTLRCRVENQDGQLQWLRDGVGLGREREIPIDPRMKIVGQKGNEEYHLQIQNVTVRDDNWYQCQLGKSDTDPPKHSAIAWLSVLVEPRIPELLDVSDGLTKKKEPNEVFLSLDKNQALRSSEGKPIHVGCRSAEGRPPARIQWALATDREAQHIVAFLRGPSQSHQQTHQHSNSQKTRHHAGTAAALNTTELIHIQYNEETMLSTVIGFLTYSPSREDNGRWLVCLASHDIYGVEARSASVQLDVFYPPKVQIKMIESSTPGEKQPRENSSITLKCEADARPSTDVHFRWTWTGAPKRLIQIDKQTVQIKHLRVEDNGAEIVCEAANAIGPSNASFPLSVAYGPRFVDVLQQREVVDIGESVTFSCDARGNPQPEIRWIRGPMASHSHSQDPLARGPTLTIEAAREWDEGEYRCIAEVPGFEPISLVHRLYLKGPPKVQLRELDPDEDEAVPEWTSEGKVAEKEVTNKNDEGAESVFLVCRVSTQMRTEVLWFRDGHRLDLVVGSGEHSHSSTRRHHHFQLEPTLKREWGVEARLRFTRLSPSDFGIYNCTARNDYGLGSASYHLVRRSVWEHFEHLLASMPADAVRWGGLAAAAFVLLAMLLCCCGCKRGSSCCCCCSGKKEKRTALHHPVFKSSRAKGDFEVRCEPDFYGTLPAPPPDYMMGSGGGLLDNSKNGGGCESQSTTVTVSPASNQVDVLGSGGRTQSHQQLPMLNHIPMMNGGACMFSAPDNASNGSYCGGGGGIGIGVDPFHHYSSQQLLDHDNCCYDPQQQHHHIVHQQQPSLSSFMDVAQQQQGTGTLRNNCNIGGGGSGGMLPIVDFHSVGCHPQEQQMPYEMFMGVDGSAAAFYQPFHHGDPSISSVSSVSYTHQPPKQALLSMPGGQLEPVIELSPDPTDIPLLFESIHSPTGHHPGGGQQRAMLVVGQEHRLTRPSTQV